ncbi:hypothetical protein FJMB80155_p10740 (plasmid) [Escherichia coli]|nr:hypothetical protein FJMB80155_p10740 [Escherichia coli]
MTGFPSDFLAIDGEWPETSPFLFEGKYRYGLKPCHDSEHHDSFAALNASSKGYGVTVNRETP